ncbi:MAG: hypothetical protein A2075_07575 [Geobacteraceae bacterium GWC2_58_44]|nr:MAG: hypothetical protein A2075_07575 [Geobacteraceae bacterium GWC2_58_44]HBG05567.1 hypothetical protein [Geobacter sp.]
MTSATRKIEPEPGARERLLTAALTLFNEKGYAAASVQEIVQAAGVTGALLLRHPPVLQRPIRRFAGKASGGPPDLRHLLRSAAGGAAVRSQGQPCMRADGQGVKQQFLYRKFQYHVSPGNLRRRRDSKA